MKVIICEDNPKQLKNITETINRHLLFKEEDIRVVLATSDPYEIIEYIKKNNDSEDTLFFFDIDLNSDINGIDLASKVKQYDKRNKIVFITTHEEVMDLVFKYKIEALDFIVKSTPEQILDRIAECISIAYERFNEEDEKKTDLISIKSKKKIIRLDPDDIIYFESSQEAHRITAHLINRSIQFYGKIKGLTDLNKDFFQCHQSFVVNRTKIRSYNTSEKVLIMENGDLCIVSVRKHKEVTNLIK